MAKKMLVSFILDETGSMQRVKGQTISGFNEYVNTLKSGDSANDIQFTLTKFNSEKVEVVHTAVSLNEVDKLTENTYHPGHLTPLYDAVGRTIASISKKKRVLIVIQTDGAENASQEYTRKDIFDLITEKKAKEWTFVFLGADQDAWAAGQAMGLDKGNVMSYASADTHGALRTLATATMSYVSRDGAKTASFFVDDGALKTKQSRREI